MSPLQIQCPACGDRWPRSALEVAATHIAMCDPRRS